LRKILYNFFGPSFR